MAHITKSDAALTLGALALAFLAKALGVNGEFFSLASAVVGFTLGFGLKAE